MLTTLFGELPPPARPACAGGDEPAMLGTCPIDAAELVVDDSAAQAMRHHLVTSRADLDQAGAMITLLDPSRLWGPQLIEALADAGGRPVERLVLRERGSLRTLAVIDRARVRRHDEEPLKVYHPDIRCPGAEGDGVAAALAERSQLTVVLVGGMAPHALAALVRVLLVATQSPHWVCPLLLFVMPPRLLAWRERLLLQPWPPRLRVQVAIEPLGATASVWNLLLDAWESGPPGPGLVASVGANLAPTDSAAAVDTAAWSRVLRALADTEGLLACGIVDASDGSPVARGQVVVGEADLDALARGLSAARRACRASLPEGTPEPDELLVTLGSRQGLLRMLPHSPGRAFVALVERAQANLALLRFRLADVEKLLA